MKDFDGRSEALRVLVVRVGAMGDVLHGMPAVAALRAAMLKAYIGWAVEPRWASLLRAEDGAAPRTAAMPLVDRVHLVPTREWSKKPVSMATARSVLALRRELRAERYGIAIDLQGSVRSSVIAWMSGARPVVGRADPREGPARWLYTERVTTRAAHVVRQAAEIVSAALDQRVGPLPVALPVDPVAEAWAEAVVAEDARPMVVLAPTAGWGAKQWPAVRFGKLARALGECGFRVVVNASPVGVDAVANLVEACSGGVARPLACSIPQLTSLLRRARLVVAGDSGPLHLAAALRTPVVALFGPTDPARTGPFGTESRVLRHLLSGTDHRRHAETEAGLALIGVDEVLRAVLDVLRA